MYEIIANPEDYQIDHLVNGTGNASIEVEKEEREKWAREIENFSQKMMQFAERSGQLAEVLKGDQKIITTPASFKTLKIQLFSINEKIQNAIEIANKLESDIVKKE
ncbi:MAG: hypothetical protein R6V41_00425 [Desulfobacteraceae bacterium]